MILPFGYSCIVCSLGMDGNPTCQVCTSDTTGLPFEADKCNGQYQDRKHGQVVCKESILNLWKEFDFITEILETFTAMIDKLQANLLVHPLCENPQNPAKHASQLVPPTPGLQGHCPVTSSQFCSIEPIRSHVHRWQPLPELIFQ